MHFLDILADEDSAYIFALSCVAGINISLRFLPLTTCSDRENQIIRHPSACFVIGRSGTGLVRLMYLVNQTHCLLQKNNNDALQNACCRTISLNAIP